MATRRRIYLPYPVVLLGTEWAWWLELEETAPGVFTVVDDNIRHSKEAKSFWQRDQLGFCYWDDSVELLSGADDAYDCLGVATHLRWKDVELEDYEYRAPSWKRLLEAFAHVEVCDYCPGDF